MRKNRPGTALLALGGLLIAIGIIAMLLKSLDPNEFNTARCLDVWTRIAHGDGPL